VGSEKAKSKPRKSDLSNQEHAFLLKSSKLSLEIVEKHLKMMKGCLKLKQEKNDQVEFIVQLLLPDSIEDSINSLPRIQD